MDGDEVLLAVFVVAFYVYLLYSTITNYKQKKYLKKLLRRTKTSTIKDAKNASSGYVEIKGQLCKEEEVENKNIEELLSPVSRSSCMYYDVHLEEKVTRCTGTYNNRNCQTYWITVHRDQKSKLFRVKDDTGEMLIDISNASTNFDEDLKDEVNLFREGSELTKAYLDSKNLSGGGLMGDKYRLTEVFLQAGDPIYAIGKVFDIDGQLLLSGENNSTFIVSDKPENLLTQEYNTSATLNLIGMICLLAIPASPIIFFILLMLGMRI